MNILHITPHMGLGVGTVIMGWIGAANKGRDEHILLCLDYINDKAREWCVNNDVPLGWNHIQHTEGTNFHIGNADIVVVHYWDHPMLAELFSKPVPDCRLVFWAHKKYDIPQSVLAYPDLFLDVSPIQGHGRHIWSTGDMTRFFEIKPKKHKGFNIGYVGTVDWKKLHPNFIEMCMSINIPGVHFTIVGENNTGEVSDEKFTFTGKVDDVAPYLAEFDLFGYPLRPDHYGTCEQVLGEAMAAGVVPVVMDNQAEKLIVEHGINGLTSMNEYDYVDNIKFLYDNRKLRKELSVAARESARRIYSTETMISEWDKVSEEMMLKPKTSRGIL
jgi:glycosyltransferase involved in cell wall biosynthesis